MENTTKPTNRERAESLVKDLALADQINKIEVMYNSLDDVTKSNWVLRNNNEEFLRRVTTIQDQVRTYFKDELDGDKNGTVTMDLEDINALLTTIGADEILFTYSAKVTISFVIEGVEADDEDDAVSKIQESIDWSVAVPYEHINDEEIEVTDVEAE